MTQIHSNRIELADVLRGVAIFIAQYTFCRWWLSTHRQGPMEWLWKKATWINSSK